MLHPYARKPRGRRDSDLLACKGFSFRPETRLLLHTAEPDEEKRRRAAALSLPLLDKL
jgi:hypothetical protein